MVGVHVCVAALPLVHAGQRGLGWLGGEDAGGLGARGVMRVGGGCGRGGRVHRCHGVTTAVNGCFYRRLGTKQRQTALTYSENKPAGK